jgi:hypothetical protein
MTVSGGKQKKAGGDMLPRLSLRISNELTLGERLT